MNFHTGIRRVVARTSAIAIGRVLRPTAVVWLAFVSVGLGASRVTLSWDGRPEPEIVGYHVLSGTTSHQYDEFTEVIGDTRATLAVEAGVTYYFAVTAFNEKGLDSEPSAEVSYISSEPWPAPTPEPVPTPEPTPAPSEKTFTITFEASADAQTWTPFASEIVSTSQPTNFFRTTAEPNPLQEGNVGISQVLFTIVLACSPDMKTWIPVLSAPIGTNLQTLFFRATIEPS